MVRHEDPEVSLFISLWSQVFVCCNPNFKSLIFCYQKYTHSLLGTPILN